MAYTFKFDGVEVVADSPAEAFALINQLRRQPAPKPAPASTPTAQLPLPSVDAQKRPAPAAEPDETLRHAHAFLVVIRNGGAAGVTSEDMQKALGAEHPKGVGARVGKINGWLRDHGFAAEEVYRKGRTAVLGRTWHAGPKIEAALAKAEEVLGAR